MSENDQTLERLARIETHMASMNETLKKIADDHETRIRHLEKLVQLVLGVLKLLAWLGAPSTAAVIFFLASKGH